MKVAYTETEHLRQQAMIELRSRYKRERVTGQGRPFYAEPNFQETIFREGLRPNPVEIDDNHTLISRAHRPLKRTGEYIVTFQIIRHDS